MSRTREARRASEREQLHQSAGGGSFFRRRHGVTLVELLVVLATSSVFFCAIYLFWISSTRQTVDLEARVAAVARGQAMLAVAVRELQQARRLLAPAPGDPAQPGCVFVSGDGQVVALSLERPDARPGRLVRTELATGARTIAGEGVLDLACRTAVVPAARDPDLMHVTLSLAGPRERPMFLVTSARTRGRDTRCPTER
jgi:hypothetical protein